MRDVPCGVDHSTAAAVTAGEPKTHLVSEKANPW